MSAAMPGLMGVMVAAVTTVLARHGVSGAETFGVALKGIHLRYNVEVPVFTRNCSAQEG